VQKTSLVAACEGDHESEENWRGRSEKKKKKNPPPRKGEKMLGRDKEVLRTSLCQGVRGGKTRTDPKKGLWHGASSWGGGTTGGGPDLPPIKLARKRGWQMIR